MGAVLASSRNSRLMFRNSMLRKISRRYIYRVANNAKGLSLQVLVDQTDAKWDMTNLQVSVQVLSIQLLVVAVGTRSMPRSNKKEDWVNSIEQIWLYEECISITSTRQRTAA